MTAPDRSPKASAWDWKRPEGHENQPLLEWWLEQVAVVIILKIGRRAHRRGDRQTLMRAVAISQAGAGLPPYEPKAKETV